MEKIEKWEPAPGEWVAVRRRSTDDWERRIFVRHNYESIFRVSRVQCVRPDYEVNYVKQEPGAVIPVEDWNFMCKLDNQIGSTITIDALAVEQIAAIGGKKISELETDPEHYKMPESSEFKLERIPALLKGEGGFATSTGVKYDICKEHGYAEVQWYLHDSPKCPVCEGISSLSRSIDEMREEKNQTSRMVDRRDNAIQELHEQIDALQKEADEPEQLTATQLRAEEEEAKTIKLDSKAQKEFQQAFSEILIGEAIKRLVKPEALK